MKLRYMSGNTKKILASLLITILMMTLISGSLFASASGRRHGWIQIDQAWYLYINNTRQTGWQQVGRDWFYLDPITGIKQTGWLIVGGDRFFLDENGAMQTGWIEINGTDHQFGPNGVWLGIRPLTSSTNSNANFSVNPRIGTDRPANENNFIRNRPVAVSINNVRAALPQHSISQADIIYETLVEGGITRMLAIFYDISHVGEIGSIRSVRPYLVDIAASHDAILVHGGGSPQAMQSIERRNICNIDGVFGPGAGAFYRVPQRTHIHSLFTTGPRIIQEMTSLGIRTMHFEGFRSSPIFATDGTSSLDMQDTDYADESAVTSSISSTVQQAMPIGSGTASMVSVRFSSSNTTVFAHNTDDNRYYVSHHNNLFYIDGNDNSLVNVTNIIILRTDVSVIPEDGAGRLSIATTGRGTGYFISSGRFTQINWSRSHENAPFEYSLPDGTPLRLAWGRTYICIVPLNAEITIN